MPKLTCDVRNCSHNKDNLCCLSLIEVDGPQATNVESTCCSYFGSSEYTSSNCSHDPQYEVDIACKATGCLFNDHCKCNAVNVGISGASTASCSHDTQCGSFWSK
ncbi:MAG: DUF1540 domain-containing protein [Cellulosilyticaceae bacterium]